MVILEWRICDTKTYAFQAECRSSKIHVGIIYLVWCAPVKYNNVLQKRVLRHLGYHTFN